MIEILYRHPCPHPGGEKAPCFDCYLAVLDVIHNATGTAWRATRAIYTAEAVRFLHEHRERAQKLTTGDIDELLAELQLRDPDPWLAYTLLYAFYPIGFWGPTGFEPYRQWVSEVIEAFGPTDVPPSFPVDDPWHVPSVSDSGDWTWFDASPDDPEF